MPNFYVLLWQNRLFRSAAKDLQMKYIEISKRCLTRSSSLIRDQDWQHQGHNLQGRTVTSRYVSILSHCVVWCLPISCLQLNRDVAENVPPTQPEVEDEDDEDESQIDVLNNDNPHIIWIVGMDLKLWFWLKYLVTFFIDIKVDPGAQRPSGWKRLPEIFLVGA